MEINNRKKSRDNKNDSEGFEKSNKIQKIETNHFFTETLIYYLDYIGHKIIEEEKWNLDSELRSQQIDVFIDQVGGHKASFFLLGADLLKVIPEKTTTEYAFYLSVKNALNSTNQEGNQVALKEMSQFIPDFRGTYTLNLNEKSKLRKCLCLENIASSFTNPCIMDLKLGKINCGPDSSAKKMEKSLKKWPLQRELGYRVTAMKVHDAFLSISKKYSKAYLNHKNISCVKNAFLHYIGALSAQEYSDSLENNNPQIIKNYRKPHARAVIQTMIEKLESILCWFKTYKCYRFFSSSLLVIYEPQPHPRSPATSELVSSSKDGSLAREKTAIVKMKVCMIDFAHVHVAQNPTHGDKNCIFGLTNFIQTLKNLLSNDEEKK